MPTESRLAIAAAAYYNERSHLLMRKDFDKLQLKDDFVFCTVMRDEKLCREFLECVLGVRISRIEYLKSQETVELSANAKGVRFDVYVENGEDTVYEVEMQQSSRDQHIPKRARYYQGAIDLNILGKSKNYKSLKSSYVIFVCTFDLFGKGRHVYTLENRCLQDPELGLGDERTIVILNTKGKLNDVPSGLRNLLDYIDGGFPGDKFTAELEMKVRDVRNNKDWRLEYMTLEMKYQEKYDLGLEDGLERGREEGLERGIKEGLEEGLEKGKKSSAINMLRSGKFTDEEIALYSGLDIKKVLQIKEDANSYKA